MTDTTTYTFTIVAKKDGLMEEYPYIGTKEECRMYELELHANGWDVQSRTTHAPVHV